MTIAGDMMASLSKFDLPIQKRRIILADIIDTMADPNFALRFAREQDELAEDVALRAWWAVVALLRKTQI
jgi:hypothetical protein